MLGWPQLWPGAAAHRDSKASARGAQHATTSHGHSSGDAPVGEKTRTEVVQDDSWMSSAAVTLTGENVLSTCAPGECGRARVSHVWMCTGKVCPALQLRYIAHTVRAQPRTRIPGTAACRPGVAAVEQRGSHLVAICLLE